MELEAFKDMGNRIIFKPKNNDEIIVEHNNSGYVEKTRYISEEKVGEILDEELSNLEDCLGIGVPKGSNMESIHHSISVVTDIKKKLKLED